MCVLTNFWRLANLKAAGDATRRWRRERIMMVTKRAIILPLKKVNLVPFESAREEEQEGRLVEVGPDDVLRCYQQAKETTEYKD
ncbi:hypothetical protein CC1G_14972 [Coprinopsis cinerea okayama7|uniref:Uncharacterized protein n=1 Tax=Coprinopsis cinerea (strain Okayama-7 / 130 / ATCC MYA-4618 / FGSC 9003) TaxID=240176 RepID=D6RPA4_COPC7|nr:hypothetical protein CC1G_14972 [Coprinopsis cinerea okayama7\|eukprot:XP_002910641.1 hypothetical protein CC1G_14972 [Coprinopsis cinerea okayama7\